MNISKTLWLALEYAKQDRIAFIDAYSDNRSEKCVRDAYKEIAEIESLQKKLFGTCISVREAELKKLTAVDVMEIIKGDA